MARIGTAASSGLGLALALALAGAAPSGPLMAQQRSLAAPAVETDPNLRPEDQLAPSQMKPAMSAAVSQPAGSSPHLARQAAADPPADATPAARKPASVPAARTVIACSGPFAKDSGMLTLAMVFDSKNMIFSEQKVQGVDVGITVLYPNDPKRRLEVWWSNPNRTGVYLIDIAGKSTWTGPEGLRLGLTLQELEKLNHKAFKLKGFDKDGVATVSDWDGGTLASLPGGCKSGVSMRADPKAAADAVAAISADHEYGSSDAAIRAVKPTVSEILIGY